MSAFPAWSRRVLVAGALLLGSDSLVRAEPPAATPSQVIATSQVVVDAGVDDLWKFRTVEADAAGEPVLAFVPRSLLVTRAEDGAWRVTSFEPLGGDRTRVRVTLVGAPTAGAGDPRMVAAFDGFRAAERRLKERFPARAAKDDPVGPRLAALKGTWETRTNAPKGKESEVQGRLVVETGERDRTGKLPFALFRRYESVDGELRLEAVYHFWKEHSGPWRGASVLASGIDTWDVTWDESSKSLSWGEGGPGGRCQTWLEVRADEPDRGVKITEGSGCMGGERLWTRVPR